MASFVDPGEREVAELSHLAVFDTIDGQWLVSGGGELSLVCVINSQGDCLATKPVADVIGIAIVQAHSYAIVQEHFEVLNEVWVHEVASALELPVNVRVRVRVVAIHTDGILHCCLVEVLLEIRWWRRVVKRMPDVC